MLILSIRVHPIPILCAKVSLLMDGPYERGRLPAVYLDSPTGSIARNKVEKSSPHLVDYSGEGPGP
jgi:hypothetical protein